MPTKVESLAAHPDQVGQIVQQISAFLAGPNNEAALRISLICVTPTRKGEPSWSAISAKFVSLFPKSAYPLKFNADHTIRRYVLGREPIDSNFKAYLMLLLVDEFEREGAIPGKLQSEIPRAADMCRMVSKFLETKKTADLYKDIANAGAGQAIANVARALQESADNNRTHRFLFSSSPSFEEAGTSDTSYYALYRFSTTPPKEIVKTFLAIQTPVKSGVGCFLFTHVYPLLIAGQKRISRGAILTYDQCLHFIGGTSTVIRGGRDNRSATTLRNQGVKLIAIPMGGTNNQHQLMSGVFLSHNLAWQPIVGRVALIHLGYESELGRQWFDEDAAIGVFSDEDDLSSDLNKMTDRLPLQKSVKEIADHIITSIINVPHVDRLRTSDKIGFRSFSVEDGREPLE